MVLGNTFHLFLSPGHELIRRLGGLHRFMRWDRPVITDSGGFQVFSMGHGTVADEIKGRAGAAASAPARSSRSPRTGVRFRSYLDGSERFMAPETSMEVQAALGSDIALVFDECTPFNVTREYTARSTERTHRWLDRCLALARRARLAGPGRLRDRAGRRRRGPAARLRAGGRRARLRRDRDRRLARPGQGADARGRRTGRSTSCPRSARATCSGSARSTTCCAASSSGSTPSTARCRPGIGRHGMAVVPDPGDALARRPRQGPLARGRRADPRGLPVPGLRARLLARLPALPAQGARDDGRAAADDPQPRAICSG